jgi:hypothetical protein
MRTVYVAPNTAYVIRHMAYDFGGEPLAALTTLFVRIRRASDGFWWNWTASAFQSSPSSGDRDKTLVEATASLLTGLYEISWPGSASDDYVAYVEQSSGGTDYNAPEVIVLSVGSLATAAALTTAQTAITDLQARTPAALVSGRTPAVVQAMDTDVVTAAAVSAAAVTKIQAGLATAGAIAAAVWASAEGGALGTHGYTVTLLRKWLRNRLESSVAFDGRVILYDDDGTTPLLTWSLRDGAGQPITTPTGSPARRGAAT